MTESKAVQHLQRINIQDEYGTPFEVLEKAMNDYNIHPTLDVCSNQKNAKFFKYFTKEDNSLKIPWREDFFMNPPYSNIAEFIKYAYWEHIGNNVNGLCLTYSKTDTKWWHEFVEGKAEVHFIKGRIRFMDENANPTKNFSPYPSVWIIWRKK